LINEIIKPEPQNISCQCSFHYILLTELGLGKVEEEEEGEKYHAFIVPDRDEELNEVINPHSARACVKYLCGLVTP
jgi:hypothetical protein